MGVFDKDAFLSTSSTGAMETKFTPVPVNEYKNVCFINDVTVDTFKDKTTGEERPQLILKVVFNDDKLKKELGMDEVFVNDRVFVDVDPKTGAFLFGPNKNVKLGQYRSAAKQNDPKKPWSPIMLKGAGPLAAVKVSHRFDKQTGEGPFAQIDRVV